MRPSVSYKEGLLEDLKDPKEAAAYLDAALEEGDSDTFLLALRDVAEVKGGMAKLAEQSNLNRESLYRMLSEKGNPQLSSLFSVLKSLGLKLTVNAA